jgi:hypothetical protein
MLQAEKSQVLVPIRAFIFTIYLILAAALGPGVYPASNMIEYQKIFLGVKARSVCKAEKLAAIRESTV